MKSNTAEALCKKAFEINNFGNNRLLFWFRRFSALAYLVAKLLILCIICTFCICWCFCVWNCILWNLQKINCAFFCFLKQQFSSVWCRCYQEIKNLLKIIKILRKKPTFTNCCVRKSHISDRCRQKTFRHKLVRKRDFGKLLRACQDGIGSFSRTFSKLAKHWTFSKVKVSKSLNSEQLKLRHR